MTREEPPGPQPRRALADLGALLLVCTVVVLVAMRVRPLESVLAGDSAGNGTGDGLIAAAIAVPIALAIFARRRYQEALEIRRGLVRSSVEDPLTGLPNRRVLLNWLRNDIEVSRAGQGQAAALFVDLDRFKLVNDTHGHDVGDRLMQAVAERLDHLVSGTGRVIRYGGDEFVVLAPELNPVTAKRLAEQVITIVERPFTLGNESLRISACVGIALAENVDVDPVDVLHDADVAMFRAKSKGSGEVVMYDRSLASRLTPARAERQIRTALDDGAFHLHYQPVVDLATGRIVGAEALLRWIDKDRGTLSPAEFVPILEETGLIVPVGTWVLGEACRQIARITQLLPDGPQLTITVNVSPRQIAQVNFAEVVASNVAAAGIDASQVHLEITEMALLHDVGSAWATLRQVKTQGVKLALDDFGTGYSSLSYVRRFSLDMLKIDKSFVDGLVSAVEDRAIVEHVIGMAHALGMTTVAEGVERPEQVATLRQLGCRLGQGYVFSPPIPAGEFESMLVQRDHRPFEVEPGSRTDLPVTDPSSLHDGVIDLSPARPRRAIRSAAEVDGSAGDGLLVPPGMLEAADDRRATITPLLVREDAVASGTPAPDVATVEELRRRPPQLPRLREYRAPDGDA